ncbi:MAG: hypothetical protein AAF065_07440 [Verrucomicrobiota bacterium]
MKRYLLRIFLLCLAPLALFGGTDANFLSPSEADVIIESREAVKLKHGAARLVELEKVEVISEGARTMPGSKPCSRITIRISRLSKSSTSAASP